MKECMSHCICASSETWPMTHCTLIRVDTLTRRPIHTQPLTRIQPATRSVRSIDDDLMMQICRVSISSLRHSSMAAALSSGIKAITVLTGVGGIGLYLYSMRTFTDNMFGVGESFHLRFRCCVTHNCFFRQLPRTTMHGVHVRLRSVQVIYRHGARTPLHVFPGEHDAGDWAASISVLPGNTVPLAITHVDGSDRPHSAADLIQKSTKLPGGSGIGLCDLMMMMID